MLTNRALVSDTIFDGFVDDYEKAFKDGMTMRKLCRDMLQTRLVYISDMNSKIDLTQPMRVAIWEVSSVIMKEK